VAVNPSPKISMSRSQSAHVVALERIHPSLSVLYSPADWESIIKFNRTFINIQAFTIYEYSNSLIAFSNRIT
jgi:hypothetical protein